MIKKTITYTDYNGEERTEEYLFNMNYAEIVEMNLTTDGGIQQLLEKIIAEKDQKELIKIFKTIILKSYGVKSADGKHFRKSPEISKDFESTEAYSVLFMELATNSEAAAEFIRGAFPQAPQNSNAVIPVNAN